MDDYSQVPVADLVHAIRIAIEWIDELIEEGADEARIDEVVELLRPVFNEYIARSARH